jgi:nicotinamidase-related amidase
MKTSLLLVDIQNDYFPGGKMELVGMDEAAMRAKELLETLNPSPQTR